MRRQQVDYRVRVGQMVAKRQALEKEKSDGQAPRNDFFHQLSIAVDPETGSALQGKELIGEAALLVGAGTDTSSATLSGLFFYLTSSEPHNRQALSRLTQEIRTTFGEVDEIKFAGVNSKLVGCKYLRVCIDEALRLSPPVPGLLERLVLNGGATVDGVYVPAGYTITAAPYAVHHGSGHFGGHENEFIPERFLDDTYRGKMSMDAPITATPSQKQTFMAFSQGPRGCLGKTMAYMEMSVAVARLLFLYDIRRSPKRVAEVSPQGGKVEVSNSDEYITQDWFLVERAGPFIDLRRRADIQYPNGTAS